MRLALPKFDKINYFSNYDTQIRIPLPPHPLPISPLLVLFNSSRPPAKVFTPIHQSIKQTINQSIRTKSVRPPSFYQSISSLNIIQSNC